MSALPDLNGKIAVVTGGASGIGKGIARQLIAEGAHVIIADIEEDALHKTASEIGAAPVQTDVSDAASVAALAKEALNRFGTVHIVCNNAGIGPMAAVADLTLDDWRWMVGVNLWGVIHGIHAFLPILRANADGGHIVNTASMAGLDAPPRLGAYATCKFGVVGLTEVLAQELEAENSKVGVSVLCPGTVRTNIGRSSRNRPPHLSDAGFEDIDIEREGGAAYRWITPDDAGAVVVRAIKNGYLYALTHPDWYGRVKARHDTIAEAFRVQAESGPPVPR
jgi:NAD(P)-dependent dehydrogenase (short-subunit alcohol dehydrogenase family)